MLGKEQMIRRPDAKAVAAIDSAILALSALAIMMLLMVARPSSAHGQESRAVSAWTVEACRMEIERRGWRITANESPETPSGDRWVWFRLATEVKQTNDVLCAEAPRG